MKETWITRCFGDLPVGTVFWWADYEMTKVSESEGEYSGDVEEFSLETEVGILILG